MAARSTLKRADAPASSAFGCTRKYTATLARISRTVTTGTRRVGFSSRSGSTATG
jgi:hypothetical protein